MKVVELLAVSSFLVFVTALMAVTGKAQFPLVSELPASQELPDPLLFFNGERVGNASDWQEKRRPELKALFQHYMYGYFPPAPDNVRWKIQRVEDSLFEGKATRKEVTITFGPEGTPPLHLLVVTPNRVSGPVPVFLGINFCGNHAVLDDPGVALPEVWMRASCQGVQDHRATEEGRGSRVDVWSIEKSVDQGYAVATFYHGDLDPDHPDFSDGVHPHYWKTGQKAPEKDDWGTIAAWAWGAHRAVDYLTRDPGIDGKKIAIVGHSRNGKASLLAAAFDERISLAIPHQAGCGGTAPSRGTVGESVQRINDSFPHWFNDVFPEFNQQVERLPFDQHSLIALVAPRPVLLTNAVEDTWANPAGQFEMLQAADPVYRLLGVEGLEERQMPDTGRLVGNRLGYFIRPGKHSMTPEDWEVFRKFADRHFK